MSDSRRFGRYEIRPSQRQLLIDGQVAPLGARAFDLLLALIERSDRIVAKSELLDLVWPNLVVEENNLQVQVSSLRKLLGPDAITTIPGRGYRFALGDAQPAAGEAEAAAAARPVATVPARSNLPAAAPPLFGRDDDIDALCAELAQHRIVTIVGAGGIGKTVLARATAHRCLETFRDGAWWVDLGTLSNNQRVEQGITQSIALAVGVPLGEGDAEAQLARGLLGRQLLLVLDNCEHVAGGVAAVLARLLDAAPEVTALATSQSALHLAGEQVWRLAALALPPPDASLEQARACAGFALFEQRARALDQRFSVAADLAQAIALCRQLDGNALAIEMAAARAPQIGIRGLNERLADRLRLLRSGAATVPSRQQSLRAMLDWSCSLLGDVERRVLRRLAVFAGSFGLDVAQQVVVDETLDEWAALDSLGTLVDHSLLQVDGAEPPRYHLLESTRIYAGEMLGAAGESERVIAEHGRAMARLALRLHDDALVLGSAAVLQRYAAEYADLEAAFDRACERGDAGVAGCTGRALAALDGVRGIGVMRRRRMAAAYALLPAAGDALTRARLWSLAGPASSIALPDVPRLQAARARAQAWREVGDMRELYQALSLLVDEHARTGDLDAARATLAEALAMEDPSWPPALRMVGAQAECDITLYSPDATAARSGLQRMLQLAELSGDARRVGLARFRLADHVTGEGDVSQAIALGEACVADPELAYRPMTYGMALANLCSAYLQAGRDAEARQAAARALPLLRAHLYAGVLFNHLALLAVRGGDAETAARLLGHADRWYASYQSPQRQATEARVMAPALAAISEALGEAQCTRLRGEGALLDDLRADALAWELLREPPAA